MQTVTANMGAIDAAPVLTSGPVTDRGVCARMSDLRFASVFIASKATSSVAHACLGRKRGAAIARTKVAAAIVHMSSLVTLAWIAFGCHLSNTLGARPWSVF